MADARHRTGFLILGALLFSSGGCNQPHPGWEPPLVETSTRFLQDQVEDALSYVRAAREDARTDPGQAEKKLDDAVRTLERMSTYYLPLLEARERAYDAHRFLYFGETHRAISELEIVEDLLDEVARNGGEELLPEMEEPLNLVAEAKAAVMATSDEAPDLIRSLAVKLDTMALKGDLELPDDWPASGSEPRARSAQP